MVGELEVSKIMQQMKSDTDFRMLLITFLSVLRKVKAPVQLIKTVEMVVLFFFL